MRLGIFAKTFAGQDPNSVLSAAGRAGYACVQYNMACSGLPAMPDAISGNEANAIALAARQHGTSIAAVSGTYNMIHPDHRVRETGLVRLRVLAARCKAMGTSMITLCTGSRDPHDQWQFHPENASKEAWSDLLREMEQALAIAEAYDLVLGVEPELANVVSSANKTRQLIQDLQSDRIAVVLDAANLFEQTSLAEQHRIVSASIDCLAEHIHMAHAKDRLADGTFVTAGRGVLDYPHYLACLKRAGFSGPLVTHGLSASEAPNVALYLSAQLASIS